MPRGVYPRTQKQLEILRLGGVKGRKIAWSLRRGANYLEKYAGIRRFPRLKEAA